MPAAAAAPAEEERQAGARGPGAAACRSESGGRTRALRLKGNSVNSEAPTESVQ